MKIMFVCTSNVCRSIMAEAFLKEKIKNNTKLKEKIEVYSAGILAQDGDGPMFNVIEIMREYGINIKEYRSTSLKNSKIQQMNLILCVGETNKNTLIRIYPELKNKIYTLKEYIELEDEMKDIIEPKGYDIEIYRMCSSEIEKCINKLIEKLEQSEE